MGGGNSLTENAPTYFHTFHKRKILTASDSIANYREVTADQKRKLEEAAAAWTRPPQAFIDRWNSACGKYGRYNEATGYFELNGLMDLTYAEAMNIMEVYSGRIINFSTVSNKFYSLQHRTLIPFENGNLESIYSSMFDSCNNLRVLRLWKEVGAYKNLWLNGANRIFDRCPRITKWLDIIRWFGNNTNASTFTFDGYKWNTDNHPFEYFRFMGVNFNIDCSCYENIGIDSFQFVVRQRLPLTDKIANPFTVTVHPKVYTKLTGDTTWEHVAAMPPEELAEWTALLVEAAEMQVMFATV